MSLKRSYLLIYNIVSLALWTYLTISTLHHLAAFSLGTTSWSFTTKRGRLYNDLLSPWLTGTQTLAFLEIPHAALGIVRAPISTVALQICGKNLVVWTIMVPFPGLVAQSNGFAGCLLAWGCSEVIRYAFFVAQLSRGTAPPRLRWLRYSAFIVLYPPGFLSEAWLVYVCLTGASGLGVLYKTYLLMGLLAYIPAGYVLYTHMLSQRQRALKHR